MDCIVCFAQQDLTVSRLSLTHQNCTLISLSPVMSWHSMMLVIPANESFISLMLNEFMFYWIKRMISHGTWRSHHHLLPVLLLMSQLGVWVTEPHWSRWTQVCCLWRLFFNPWFALLAKIVDSWKWCFHIQAYFLFVGSLVVQKANIYRGNKRPC